MLNVRSKLNIYVGLLFGLATFSSANAAVSGSVVVSNEPHRIVILNENAPALKKRVDMIRAAQGSIEIETWNFDLSRSSRLLFRELIAKKKAMPSVQVRILVDYYPYGDQTPLNPAIAQALAKMGIEVKYYNQVSSVDLLALNHRNHSKLFIVDGSEVILGSRNLSDDHFGMRQDLNYVNTDFWVSGPIVRSIQLGFYEFWNSSIVKEPEGSFGNGKFEDLIAIDDQDRLLAKNVKKFGSEVLNDSPVYEVNHLRYVKDGPMNVDSDRIVTNYVNNVLSKVNHSLLIENWGFVPNSARLSILDGLMAKGVQVRLLTNGFDAHMSSSLSGMAWAVQKKEIPKGMEVFYSKSAPEGARLDPAAVGANCVYETHSKTIVRDRRYVDIGSYNLDGRSAYINHEDLLTVDSREIAEAMTAEIQARVSRSERITADGKNQDDQSIFPPYLQGAKEWIVEQAFGIEDDLIGYEF